MNWNLYFKIMGGFLRVVLYLCALFFLFTPIFIEDFGTSVHFLTLGIVMMVGLDIDLLKKKIDDAGIILIKPENDNPHITTKE